MTNTRAHHRKTRRRAMALPLVLMCILLATALGVAITKAVLLQYRHGQMIDRQYQALWLADSGVQRAVYHLRNSPGYTGETWEVSADKLSGTDSGKVVIKISEENAQGWTVEVEAIYPDVPHHRAVEQRQVFIPMSDKGS